MTAAVWQPGQVGVRRLPFPFLPNLADGPLAPSERQACHALWPAAGPPAKATASAGAAFPAGAVESKLSNSGGRRRSRRRPRGDPLGAPKSAIQLPPAESPASKAA